MEWWDDILIRETACSWMLVPEIVCIYEVSSELERYSEIEGADS